MTGTTPTTAPRTEGGEQEARRAMVVSNGSPGRSPRSSRRPRRRRRRRRCESRASGYCSGGRRCGSEGGVMDGGQVLLQVDGTHLVAGDGSPRTLRGVGLGGGGNMGKFGTRGPPPESPQGKAGRQAVA